MCKEKYQNLFKVQEELEMKVKRPVSVSQGFQNPTQDCAEVEF